jgi:hypothetical protein
MSTSLSAVATLIELAPPPSRPYDPGTPEQWDAMEAKLGTRLPSDFRAIAERYGGGTFDHFIHLASVGELSRAPRIDELLDSSNMTWDTRKGSSYALPRGIYPKLGGLLPCGVTDNGDLLHWKTGGDPDRWTIAVVGARLGPVEEFKCGFAEFLVRALTGKIRPQAFRGNVPDTEPPRFDPAR